MDDCHAIDHMYVGKERKTCQIRHKEYRQEIAHYIQEQSFHLIFTLGRQSYKLFVTFATVEVNLSELNFVTIIRQIVAIVSQTKARRPSRGFSSSRARRRARSGWMRSSSTNVIIAEASDGHA